MIIDLSKMNTKQALAILAYTDPKDQSKKIVLVSDDQAIVANTDELLLAVKMDLDKTSPPKKEPINMVA
jgi:hypothetical protein